jgi:hypothetical protein
LEPGESTGFATQVTASCLKKDENIPNVASDPPEYISMAPGTYTCNLKAVNGTTELAKTQITLLVTS